MRRSKVGLIAGILATALLAIQAGNGPGGLPRTPSGVEYVSGEILLKFKPEATALERSALRAELGATTLNTFRSGAEHWRLGSGITVEQAVARLSNHPLIAYAEPNYIVSLDVVPNDPRLPELWGMINTGQTGGTPDADIDADLAWGVSTGSPGVLVGVIDTGVDYNHPDLAPNIWTNPGEIPGNGLDDDGNGFVDDVHGYDFANNDGDPFDDNGHGTHVSGTIGAVGNNGIGVVGVNWSVKIMALKFLTSGGSGTTANAVRAVDYATMMGVDLTSNSWGGGGFSQALYDAIANANAHDIAFVAAAGNSSANTDTSPHYPSAYDLPNIIAVAATDHNDNLASFSNWGPTTVDLAAPGVDVLSTLPGNSYGQLSGTSMATPHVSGVCALIRAVNPNIPVAQMKNVLLSSVDVKPSLTGRMVSNGRLNAFFAIAEPDTVAPGMIHDLEAVDPGSNTMGLRWTATGDDGEDGTANFYEVRYSTSPITEDSWPAATRAGNEPVPAASGSAQSMEVRNLASSTTYFFAIRAFDEWGNPGPLSNIATGTTLPPPTGQVSPTFITQELFTGERATQYATLSNVGEGTLDFTIPAPLLGEPQSPSPFLDLGKDDPDPRSGDPIAEGRGGPDGFGYRWVDSDEPNGPVFNWQDISATGTPLNLTGDDATSPPVSLGFNFPFYGSFFDSIRVSTNGFLSFTSSSTAFSNQPLPNTGAPENLIAPFWDDLDPKGVNRIFFQSFGSRAIVQWQAIPRFSGPGTYTFQVILEASGAITFQYLDVQTGDLTSATVGIQNATKTVGLQVAFNQPYLHDNLAVRISAVPAWLRASPTSGRLRAGQSTTIALDMDASGLEGGTYPGFVQILTNDPANPTLVIEVSLHVTGAPDARVQPASLEFGDSFLGQPYQRTLIVANEGTDTLHVSDIVPSHPELNPSPRTFEVPPHGSQNVTVTWVPSSLGPFSGSVTVLSDDLAEPSIVVPVSGNSIPAPVMLFSPTSFDETLYTGNQVTRPLHVTNTGGSDLQVTAAADLGNGLLIYADDVAANGAGGPDAFGYRWKDSDASGGPTFSWVDISTTGTPISFSSSDDALSSAISMGMTFPFYGNNFTSLKVSTNGFLTFTTTETSSRPTNSTLPSTSGAPNMIAVFWDDLHLRSGDVRYLNDGTRFIVQWTNVGRFTPSTGQSYTFQVQLYPNGKILIQFLTMTGVLNSATIGIQDQARTIGLLVNFNTNYVHNNLAIQISRTPDWLVVTPSSAVVPPGQSFDFNVTFDSTDRTGGVLEGAVVLRTNVPDQAEERVPARLTVIGVPIAATIPASFDFGTRFAGYSYLTTFQVVNNGTDVLNVTDVFADDPTLFVEEVGAPGGEEEVPEGAFPLPPGGSRLFNLRWSPTSPATLNARVHVISNDPVNPDRQMPVTGVAIPPPVAVWAPTSFSEAANVGDVVHRTLRLENRGGSDLTFVSQIGLQSGASVPVDSSPELKKEEEDTRPGLLGSGGPDGFGYTWRDSDHPGGPVFDWFDIGAIGTPVTFSSNDDGNSGPFSIGFPFPFYGQSFSTVRICTNGWISFTDTSTSFSNTVLPSSSAPANLLAVFWDDLHIRNGNVKYYSDGNRFVVQYTNVDQFSPQGESYTFQVILYRNGRIVYQYLSMTTNDLQGATIGIQNATRNDGLTVVFNAPYVHNNLAVEFRPPAAWLTVNPDAGTIPPAGFLDLDVTFDATQLIGGTYNARIELSTNDPANALIGIPASFFVTGIPDIAATPGSLLFPTTYVGCERTLTTSIQNAGTDVLEITGMSVSGDFTASGLNPPVSLPVGGSIPVTVRFAPTTDGLRTGELVLHSNDPDENPLTIPLEGQGLFPPELSVSPGDVSAVLPPASETTRLLRVCNTGGSSMSWTSGVNIVSGGGVGPYESYELGKEESDPHPGILGSGGPDLFGYRWKDSNDPAGPVFDWVDITGVGTPITELDADDEVVGPFPIGFPFPFYGNSFSTVKVSSNGWLSFTYTGASSLLSNLPLPNTGGADNMLAGFWDDLSFSPTHGSGRAYYYNDGTRFILSFVNVPHYPPSGAGTYTFQYILYPNGKIVFQYLSMSGLLNSATIGIQNAAKNDGLTVVFNAPYVHDNLAIEFKAIPQWATLSPTGGVVPAGTCQDVTLTLNSSDLEHGWHDAMVRIQVDNDPCLASRFQDIPVRLAVNRKPIADPGPATVSECTGNLGAWVTLDGTGSRDDDGDPLTWSWSAPGILFDDPTSPTPTAFFPLGTTVVRLVVHDGFEPSDPATVPITIVDTIRPTIGSSARPDFLWPPNHKMASIDVTVTVSDICDPNPSVVLESLSSSEPDDAQGGGDGHTTNDIQEAAIGTADDQFLLRAEREGNGPGRTYTAVYRATDAAGNSSSSSTDVRVPHDLADVVEPIFLRVENKDATVVLWDPVPGAVHYDIVRGDLKNLRIEGSDVNLGSVVCLERESPDASTVGNEDRVRPAPGQGFFYLVQFYDGIQDSSYGSENVGRARIVPKNGGDCP